jgi:general stress protein CsbA
MIAMVGLSVPTIGIPYLLVFLPQLDVLIQSVMVYDIIAGFKIPCRTFISFILAIAYGCMSIFYNWMPDLWLRFNICLIMGIAIVANNRYVATTLVMLIVAVSIYKAYLDTEGIWATIVITYYLIRLERHSDRH